MTVLISNIVEFVLSEILTNFPRSSQMHQIYDVNSKRLHAPLFRCNIVSLSLVTFLTTLKTL
jgi:hypothetical protein